MPTPDLTAGQVMDKAASLMNDSARSIHSYVTQLPYLQMALQDLRKLLELNNSPVTIETSTVISAIAAGTSIIRFGVTNPHLPDDLIDIQSLWASNTGAEQWIPISKRSSIPANLFVAPGGQWNIYSWQDNELHLPYSIGINDLKLLYIKSLFTNVVDENSQLSVINADSYLEFRTAALLAEFVAENPTRALALNFQARESFDVMIGIDNKSKQQYNTRRRPFRAAFKARR